MKTHIESTVIENESAEELRMRSYRLSDETIAQLNRVRQHYNMQSISDTLRFLISEKFRRIAEDGKAKNKAA